MANETQKDRSWWDDLFDFAILCVIFVVVYLVYLFLFLSVSKQLASQLRDNIVTTAFLLGLGCYISFKWHKLELPIKTHFLVYIAYVPLNTLFYYSVDKFAGKDLIAGIACLLFTLIFSTLLYTIAGRMLSK